MSKNLSATKRTQISIRNRFRNRIYKSTIKTLTKKYLASLHNSNYDHALSNLAILYSKIDKAIKRGVIHKNNGSRKKSSLARAMKNALQ
uniref:Small ribosomal subunit protein bS20c n=1 Tax=Caulacanthus okamurae TaxID=152008 RepID=A0A6H1U915_9FLOR|nr:30S ribosomal protein S20 [Caulacanthus okamurae]QIZ74700.1 30S ribosomal protein S20 [Caulacanthus okamurae]